jgi:uncharacterized protein YgbK (DUF1537 family)
VNGTAATAASFLGLVADDLTGATDSAVEFAAAGWDARLIRQFGDFTRAVEVGSGKRLDAVTTDVRARSDSDAARDTASATAALLDAGIDRLFVKIDSTVRGSVSGQIRGALAAWRIRHPDAVAMICPAFPDHGRTVSAGAVFVNGVPLAHTAAAHDPVTPVTSSSVLRLFPGSLSWPADEPISAGAGQTQYVVDAASNEDLAMIAATIDLLGPRAVAVGSAGLAQALAARWPATGKPPAAFARRRVRRILVAVSSLHPVAQGQLKRLVSVLGDSRWVRQQFGQTPAPPVALISTPEDRASAQQSTIIAADLARQVASELSGSPFDALVLVGGDGAHAVLDLLGAAQLRIGGNIASGTPYATIVGGVADGLRVVTKSGGFGEVDSLVHIVERLSSQDRPLDGSPLNPATPDRATEQQAKEPS